MIERERERGSDEFVQVNKLWTRFIKFAIEETKQGQVRRAPTLLRKLPFWFLPMLVYVIGTKVVLKFY